MDRGDHTLQARLSAYLRSRYDSDHACRLARDIDCDPRTAKNLLGEHWPSARHWKGIARRFGRDVLEAVFSPEIDATAARLAQEIADLEEQIDRKRAHLRQAAKPLVGSESHVAASRPVAGPKLRRRG